MPSPSPLRRPLAALCAVAAWLALALQLVLIIRSEQALDHTVAHALLLFFGFLTILANLLCALVSSAHLLAPPAARTTNPLRSPWLTTATAATISIVGVVFFLALHRLWNTTGPQLWANYTLHYIVPVLFVAFWTVAIPPRSVGWRDLPRMLLLPVSYLAYVLARGAATGLYPYFFIDVPTIGYPATLRNSLVILVAYVAVAALLIAINRRQARA